MRTVTDLQAVAWPRERLSDALDTLALRGGLEPRPMAGLSAPPGGDDESLTRWLHDAASWMGLEIETAAAPLGGVASLLRTAAPGLVRLPGDGEARFVAVLRSRGRRLRVLAPDLTLRTVRLELLAEALREPVEREIRPELDRLLGEAGVRRGRLERARAALIRERLGARRVGGVWLLRLPTGAGFWRQLTRAGLARRLGVLLGAHAAQYLLWILSWWMVGRGALGGRLDTGWLLLWLLLLLTSVPFAMLVTWSQGLLAIGAGGLLKRRLLHGALRLEPEETRHQGAGQLLGRVIESEAVESLAMSGGLLGVVALVELAASAVILFIGAGGLLHAVLLLVWVGFALLVGRGYLQRRREWTENRLELTHDLVERMVGHRTRLAQERRERWHVGEDQALERFLERSRSMDRVGALLVALVPRGWFVVALAGVAPAFVAGKASIAGLAIAIGGTLLAFMALGKLVGGIRQLTGAAVSWEQVAPLFRAAERPQLVVPPVADSGAREEAEAYPTLDANDLVFRYGDRGEPVLRGCRLRVRGGERILLEGPSGGGKSTFASLLSGLRTPESGLLLLGGLDRQTVGERAWLRRVATVPQFHENHVISETFAFNLLMGEHWPPSKENLVEAEQLCRQLGLGELLDRMPAGLLQMVGETGWQLSHGERSRLYIARALLQEAELVILDESFAALDPENLRRCLQCVLERTPTLIVIAHP